VLIYLHRLITAWLKKRKTLEIGVMMNDKIKIEAALEIQKGKTYAIELDKSVNPEQLQELLRAFELKTGAKAIILVGAKMARAHNGK